MMSSIRKKTKTKKKPKRREIEEVPRSGKRQLTAIERLRKC